MSKKSLIVILNKLERCGGLRSMNIKLGLLFFLNILYVGALWHLDVCHNLDRCGQEKTRGVFKIKPELGYRLSQYILIASLLLIDFLFLFGFK